eukprot:4946728-Alexandrium_andersonii.AAC.1
MTIATTVICRYRHHAMVLTITMVMARVPKSDQTRPRKLSTAHSAPLFALSANMATRTSAEL